MNKFLLFITILLIVGKSNCIAQDTAKDTVYLFFDTSDTTTCRVDVEGKGYQMVKKYRKQNLHNYILFNICGEKFTFMKERSMSDTLSVGEHNKINYSDIDYFIRIFKNQEPTKYKHNIFDKIYIVVKVNNGTFIKYDVGWLDESIWVQ